MKELMLLVEMRYRPLDEEQRLAEARARRRREFVRRQRLGVLLIGLAVLVYRLTMVPRSWWFPAGWWRLW